MGALDTKDWCTSEQSQYKYTDKKTLMQNISSPEMIVYLKQKHCSIFKIHSRYMKMQHIKFEILNERLSEFKWNLIQLNFVQNMLVIGRMCKANFHPFGDVRDDVTSSLDVCHR